MLNLNNDKTLYDVQTLYGICLSVFKFSNSQHFALYKELHALSPPALDYDRYGWSIKYMSSFLGTIRGTVLAITNGVTEDIAIIIMPHPNRNSNVHLQYLTFVFYCVQIVSMRYRILGSISTRTSIRRVCIFCRYSSMGTSIHGVLYNETY